MWKLRSYKAQWFTSENNDSIFSTALGTLESLLDILDSFLSRNPQPTAQVQLQTCTTYTALKLLHLLS